MDDERVGGESSKKLKTLTLGQFIVDQCPRYMAMGVPYDEYWNGDYTRLPFFRKAEALKRKEKNAEAWLQGVYILRAIGSILPNSEETYPSEPLPMTQEDLDYAEEQKRQKEIENAKAYMETMMHNINKQRKEANKDG